MNTFGAVPSCRFSTGIPAKKPEAVYFKAWHKRTINPGVDLRLTEVQQLDIEDAGAGIYSFNAIADGRERMIEEQKLWVEAEIRVDSIAGIDGPRADGLQSVVDHLVTNMDGVGFHNVGPWLKNPDRTGMISNGPAPPPPFW